MAVPISLIVVPALVVLGFRAAGRLGDDDLVDPEDGQCGVCGQFDRVELAGQVVVDRQLLARLDPPLEDVDTVAGRLLVQGDDLREALVGVESRVLQQNPREDLERRFHEN